MASRSAKRALVLSLAVITAILVVITAGRQFTDTTSAPRHPGAVGVAAAGPSQPRPTSGETPRRPADQTTRGRGSAVGSAGSRLDPGVRGKAGPATPTAVTIDSPDGRRVLSAPVDPLAASRNPDGTWAPIDPPSLSRAVWMTQSAPPAAPSTGTTAIYGHACIGLACAFNNAFRARLGSTVTVETARTELRYRASAIAQYPKTGAESLASRPNIANELLLITCAYRPDHTSVNNLVITATLIAARASRH
jgi:LPXTG-site transpeptidase (sortase) family protein